MFDNFCRRQIQHFAQGIIIGKGRLVLRHLPKLTVQPLNEIGCIYDTPDLGRICEKGGQNIPILLPAFDAGGILFASGSFKLYQIFQGLLFRDGLIDLLQISHEGFAILVADIAGTGPDLVDDAALNQAVIRVFFHFSNNT